MENVKRILMFHPHVSQDAIENVSKTLCSRWIGQGPKVAELEEKFKQIVDTSFVVAVNNIASAIRLALAVIGVSPGDEVITTPQTCTTTNHPILEQFAVPVFADIEYLTANIDPKDIERRITEKTRAIVCADYGGYPCDLDEINNIAEKYNLPVIEDAQDALGALYKGKPIGSISDFTCFSLGAVQQVTAGEGGILCIKNENVFESARRRRWFGIDRIHRKPNLIGYYDFDITEVGYGYHMTDISASMALVHLSELNMIIKRREEIAREYRKKLSGFLGITLFEDNVDRKSGHQLFTMHVQRRDDFCRMMSSKGIQVSIVHERNDLYSIFGGKRKDLPNLENFSKTNISIPLYQNLSDNNVGYIIKSIKEGW